MAKHKLVMPEEPIKLSEYAAIYRKTMRSIMRYVTGEGKPHLEAKCVGRTWYALPSDLRAWEIACASAPPKRPKRITDFEAKRSA